jgi:hypothetical protein
VEAVDDEGCGNRELATALLGNAHAAAHVVREESGLKTLERRE